METYKYKSVDEYIEQLKEPIKSKIEIVRATLREAVPQAEEVISYNMPALKYIGILVYYAAAKKHIGLYPTPSGIETFKSELKKYVYTKGAIRFSIDEQLPLQLIAKIARYRYQEITGKHNVKGKK